MLPDLTGVVPTSAEARAKHHIAALEDKLESMKQERGGKQRKTTFYVSQGRAICRMGVLYTNLEDLITKNDCRYEEGLAGSTPEYALPFLFYAKSNGINQTRLLAAWLYHSHLKRGADAVQGDDTSTLKDLITTWINQDFHPSSVLRSDDKHAHSFVHNICGKLLCPSEWDWDDNHIKAGIHNRTSDYIVSENSWPLFLYENYTVKLDNLEQGLFRSKILVQAKVKNCVASIINMRKVTPHSLAYVICQVCFALSNISSWHAIDGDFDYKIFWSNIVDFFENIPGPVTQQRVNHLLEWWTRKIFSKNHHEDLTPDVVSHISVTALVEQRKVLEDAAFNSE
ncbi:hypothetical protein BDR04DRAFT_1122268 [Suillus decipiens]|nr:hypothetical protein BDR04DRAFT_1122268 [Suillus decipiens]